MCTHTYIYVHIAEYVIDECLHLSMYLNVGRVR